MRISALMLALLAVSQPAAAQSHVWTGSQLTVQRLDGGSCPIRIENVRQDSAWIYVDVTNADQRWHNMNIGIRTYPAHGGYVQNAGFSRQLRPQAVSTIQTVLASNPVADSRVALIIGGCG